MVFYQPNFPFVGGLVGVDFGLVERVRVSEEIANIGLCIHTVQVLS